MMEIQTNVFDEGMRIVQVVILLRIKRMSVIGKVDDTVKVPLAQNSICFMYKF